jgi:uncharacterized peroxidase-related enzyme
METHVTNGILGLFDKYPQTAQTLKRLAEDILRGPGSLDPAEREMIATFVSAKNRCYFCSQSHGAIAIAMGVNEEIINAMLRADITSSLPERFRYLLVIADYTAENRYLPLGLLTMAGKAAITDEQIHDTVLITSVFCLFNRYVDLLSRYPSDVEFYRSIGDKVAEEGYL